MRVSWSKVKPSVDREQVTTSQLIVLTSPVPP
jgi:hypothetical protein